eukprot:TRINITY_DN761_c0_g1_i1.p2 TRINITY_DN761_c0_g1~~TRINITY_DN761_c0_g1_i1.p2  ORF type:complete len:205 (+),score=77.71 TRINITY_DN761_c0_g1_i1:86-700(+)
MENITGLTWLKGEPVNLKAARVFVLEFWATWCPPCRQSIPHISQVQSKYKDKDVVVIGITQEHDAAKVKKFVDGMGAQMDYHVAVDTDGSASQLMATYNVSGIPHAFVFGRDGKLVWHGHPVEPGLESAIDRALLVAKPAPAGAAPAAAKPTPLTPRSDEELQAMPVRELKQLLSTHHIDYTGCAEKIDLVQLIKQNFAPASSS